ncbi:MAG TPA: gliding motility-associated C-terminal domain-containing protein [Flavobacterium sp.]
MKIKFLLHLFLFLSLAEAASAQDISLYQQFNGRYDFMFIGNTLNLAPNGAMDPCLINTASSAELALSPADVIHKAYLYWAGSGTGDFDVELNGEEITSERDFTVTLASTGLPFFSAFADVTSLVQSTGNGNYTLSELNIAPFLNEVDYCSNGTNFGGWAIIIIYANASLPLNQLNVYDGLQRVPQEINITLSSLNVIDNEDARIGFVAWEGDRTIDEGESLTINGNLIGNPPLNPDDNAFNGTNSFTGSEDLYNMDLDVYNIQNNISIGDATAEIRLTSDRDFVMINAIVTKLNSQLPDATVSIDNIALECNSRNIIVHFTVYNLNSTNALESGVPIAIYADGVFIGFTETLGPIAIGESFSDQISLVVPDNIPENFILTFVVDDNGTGTGIATEILETNNSFSAPVSLLLSPEFNIPPDLKACNEGFGSATFDFSNYAGLILIDPNDTVSYYMSQADAENAANAIINTSSYHVQSTPATIFVRIEDGTCFSITSFDLLTKNCPPIIYNFVSANNDGVNDVFFIEGLRDIFLNFKLAVYNRWGAKIWEGDNNSADWNGRATKGYRIIGDEVPDGTYFYVLDLNDPDYENPFSGFLYLNR